jgi:hypothetical protein
MEKKTVLRLNIIFATMLLSVLAACTKTEKRENNAGTQTEVPSVKPIDNPCLRMNLVEDEEDEEESSTEESEEDADKEETDKEETDKEEIDEESGVGSTSSTSGCGDEKETPTEKEDPTNEVVKGSGRTYNVGPGIAGCEEKSEAWVAVKNGGAGVCEGTLVKWCCSAPEIALRFPTVADKLSPKMSAITDDGLKLYHCSEKDGKTIFHFAASKSTGVAYKTLFVSKTASKDGDTKGESCPVVTMEDMGFKGNAEESETEIPASIGEIEDTSKKGLLAFLKTKEHQAWRGDNKFREGGAHGKVKIFFNSKLEKSLENDKDEHEVGSIAVKEIYKGDKLDGYAVLAKHKKGEGKDTWFFYETLGGTPDFADIKAHDVGGPASCADCHTKGKDFIQSEMQDK